MGAPLLEKAREGRRGADAIRERPLGLEGASRGGDRLVAAARQLQGFGPGELAIGVEADRGGRCREPLGGRGVVAPAHVVGGEEERDAGVPGGLVLAAPDLFEDLLGVGALPRLEKVSGPREVRVDVERRGVGRARVRE